MNTLLLIIIAILTFLIYCAICVGIVLLIDGFGLELWARAFPKDEELWNKYWWYKFAIFGYILLLTIIVVVGSIKIASMILY